MSNTTFEILNQSREYAGEGSLEGPIWNQGCYWVYIVYADTLVGVLLFDENGKLMRGSDPKSLIQRKIKELTIDIDGNV